MDETAGSGGADVIAGGRERPPRRWRRIVVVGLVVVGLVGAWGDHQQRTHELRQLRAAAAEAQAVADDATRKVLGTRQYTMPLLVTSSSATVRIGLEHLIDDSAATQAERVRDARAAVAEVAVLPWHRELLDTRRAMLAAVDRRVAALDLVANGGDLAVLTSAAAPPPSPAA